VVLLSSLGRPFFVQLGWHKGEPEFAFAGYRFGGC
jgi:hypothetical protein